VTARQVRWSVAEPPSRIGDATPEPTAALERCLTTARSGQSPKLTNPHRSTGERRRHVPVGVRIAVVVFLILATMFVSVSLVDPPAPLSIVVDGQPVRVPAQSHVGDALRRVRRGAGRWSAPGRRRPRLDPAR
jgi:hypothetical protein